MITFRPAALKWRDDIEWKKAILQFIYRRTFDCISFQWKHCSHGSIPWNKDIQILKSKAHNRYCRTSLVTTKFCKDLHPSARVRRRIRHEWTYTTAKPSSAKESLHLTCWVKHLRKTQMKRLLQMEEYHQGRERQAADWKLKQIIIIWSQNLTWCDPVLTLSYHDVQFDCSRPLQTLLDSCTLYTVVNQVSKIMHQALQGCEVASLESQRTEFMRTATELQLNSNNTLTY